MHWDSYLGSITCQDPAMEPASLPLLKHQHISDTCLSSTTGPPVTALMAVPGTSKGAQVLGTTRLTLTMDTSLYGWGAFLENQLAQGRWTEVDLCHNINWLELKAAR